MGSRSVPAARGPSSGARGWALLIVNAATGEPLLVQTWDDRPRDSELWQHLVDTMRNPEHSEPHRPQGIQLIRKSLVKAWGSKLDQLKIRCELTDELPQIDGVKEAFLAETGLQRSTRNGTSRGRCGFATAVSGIRGSVVGRCLKASGLDSRW